VSVDCIIEDPRWEAIALGTLADAATDATLHRLGLEPSVFEISLLACDDTRITGLNGDFRAKPAPTNVLSIVHGTLHLLGFDHENEPDAALMEGLEVEILGKLGLADPYKS